jgi:hypothetical protein
MHSTGTRDPPPAMRALSTVVGMASLSLMTWGGRFIGMGRDASAKRPGTGNRDR